MQKKILLLFVAALGTIHRRLILHDIQDSTLNAQVEELHSLVSALPEEELKVSRRKNEC